MKKVWMLHCVNHNMYGKRDPRYYGTVTLQDIDDAMAAVAEEVGVELHSIQSNHDGVIIDKIHELVLEGVDAVIINPGAWTHYNYALHDALELLSCPIIEIHMSNIFNRDDFRSTSVIAPVATAMIAGMGMGAYTLSVRAAVDLIQQAEEKAAAEAAE